MSGHDCWAARSRRGAGSTLTGELKEHISQHCEKLFTCRLHGRTRSTRSCATSKSARSCRAECASAVFLEENGAPFTLTAKPFIIETGTGSRTHRHVQYYCKLIHFLQLHGNCQLTAHTVRTVNTPVPPLVRAKQIATRIFKGATNNALPSVYFCGAFVGRPTLANASSTAM